MGMKQIKHFNQNYQELRQLGKVAIGRRAGKLKRHDYLVCCGFARKILAARKMQGVTVLAKFHPLTSVRERGYSLYGSLPSTRTKGK